MSSISERKRANVSFAAINQYIATNIVAPTEMVVRGKDFVEWGEGNSYPDYLLSLYNSAPTLRSIVNGNIDFITGDDVTISRPLYGGAMNARGDTIRDLVKNIAKDFEIYGGFALQIIRNRMGEVAEIYHLDMRFVRSNKENNVFYYSEDWGKKGNRDAVVYPAYMKDLDWNSLDEDGRNAHASSVLFVKNVNTQVYPAPLYAASVKACEIERSIDDYHLNAINNGFTGSLLVNFNDGRPDDEQMNEIEEDFAEKFTGHQNAGRVMFCWNKTRENETTLAEPKVEDFGDRYQALAKHSRQQIFTAFRANPNLFGIPTENNGFSNEQYEESFLLYNRTQIKPVQDLISAAFNTIFDRLNPITITPFSMMNESDEQEAEANQMLAVQIGVGGTQSLTSIISDPNLTASQKEQLLQKLFNFTPQEAHNLFNENTSI